ncbi:MAG: T9SS type A sorting domain-containing protein [Bacteroidia bacterium]|nr:T9SS type A sorting domain-containing protein [Bacteroidia bacterium]
MKTKFSLIIILFIFYSNLNAQQKIHFDYDTAGNQITREFCLTCLAKTSNPAKSISDLDEKDLQKFHFDDNFSFYPNPVKEELFLKWDNSSEIKLQTIKLYSLNGSLLKSFENQMTLNNNNILFKEYPNGIYIIELMYDNGEAKTIKIIKQ